MTATSLAHDTLEELERRYLEAPTPTSLPTGCYAGEVLARLDTAGARRPFWRVTQKLGFEWIPFGIDFDRGRWFFFGPSHRIGAFDARIERSRWRDTEVVTLRYERSRLPSFIKGALYDEVKPLDDGLLLGIGGSNAEVDEGDHFFFSLRRLPR